MKAITGLFIACFIAAVSAWGVPIAAGPQGTGNEVEFYTAGILNSVEGTIEITSVPARPGAEFHTGDWYFAFCVIPGQQISADARNLLGLCAPSGEFGTRGLLAVARCGGNRFDAVSDKVDFLKPGVPVNLAVSWGKAGMQLYVNGVLHSSPKSSFKGELSPMGPLLKIGYSPFNVRAAKISTRQLPPENLTADPAKGFTQSPDTSLLWQRDEGNPQYFSTAYAGNDFSSLVPLWQPANAMAPAGTDAVIKFTGLNLSAKDAVYKVSITAKDFKGTDAGRMDENVVLPPVANFVSPSLTLPMKDTGFYNLNIVLTGPDGSKKNWKSTYMIYPANDKNIPDGRFVEYIGHNMLEQPDVLSRLGIRWGRAWNDGANYFLWYNIEPQKGVFDWKNSDNAVRNAAKNGVNILGVLGYPPLWAAENPQYKKVPHPQANMPARWKPRNVEEWSNYVYQTVSRYKGQVKYWEIYNEVDFHPPGLPATFSGTTKDYFELLKAAWAAAKKADPECKILISGFSLMTACDVNMPYDLLKMGAAKYCDFFNMHSYQGILGVDKLRQAVEAADPGKPFWQTEQAWFEISDVKKQCELTAAIQFWFVDKKFEKYFNFGLSTFINRYSNSPEPVLQVLAVIQSQLRKCDAYIGTLPDSKVRDFDIRHSFKRTDGNYFTAIGKVDAESVLHLGGEIISAEDMFGTGLKLTRGGNITILPATSVAYIVSKTPLRVVEAKCKVKGFCLNPGFEDFTGDNIAGLKGCIPNNWTFRATSFDKGGEIILDQRARTGKYALKISASGQGRVYAFFETLGLPAGKYKLSAWLKSADGKPATAYFSMFDVVGKNIQNSKIPNVSNAEYTKYSAEFELKKRPEGQVMFIIGVGLDKEQGAILCDDVELVKQPLMRQDLVQNVKVGSPDGQLIFKSGRNEVNLQNMVSRVGGAQIIDGVEIDVSRTPAVLSGGEWSGTAGKTFNIPLPGYFSRIAFLVGAMYVPAKGNSVLGTINITYRDGGTASFSLVNNKNIRDWWLASMPGGIAPDLSFSDIAFQEFGLFMPVWNNPFPGKEIASVELKTDITGLLCLAAVIAEKKE